MEQAYSAENYIVSKRLAAKVLVHLPQNINALRGYALSCFMLGEYAEALSTLLKSLEQSKEQEFEYTYIGWCFCNMDNHLKACEAFEKAVEINPLYEPALSGRTTAYVHLHSDRLEKIETLEKSLDT